MVTGGNATVYVRDMDAAIAFYVGGLGMTQSSRYGNEWATVQAGGFTIGLHPGDKDHPAPGTHGAVEIGLTVDEIEGAAVKVREAGGKDVGPVVHGSGGSFVQFHDVDGNALYLWQVPQG